MAVEGIRQPPPVRFAFLDELADPHLLVIRHGPQVEISPMHEKHDDVGPEAGQTAVGIPNLLLDRAI